MKVLRHTYPEKTTIGTWLINDRPFCVTLEDELAIAIPAGVHTLELSKSPKFDRPLPHIYSDTIPPKRGIRVHQGKTHEHTLGCILVGFELRMRAPELAQLGDTEAAENAIVDQLRRAGGRTQLEIVEVGR